MATWDEVKEYARAQYELSKDEDDFFTLIFEYENRSQTILVQRFTAYDQAFVEFRTGVCEAADIDPTDALKRNAELPIGGLVLRDGLYLLVFKFPLANLDIEEFELSLHALAMTGDGLEEAHSSRGDVF